MGCLEVYFRTSFLHDDEPADPEIDEVDEVMAEINQQLAELASLPGTQNSKKDEKVSYTTTSKL